MPKLFDASHKLIRVRPNPSQPTQGAKIPAKPVSRTGVKRTFSEAKRWRRFEKVNTIINGVNTLQANLTGKTVGDVRAMLAQVLNIDPAAVASINGERADADRTLGEGDELEFVKSAGEKG